MKPEPSKGQGPSAKILIVDDVPANIAMMERILRKVDAQVVTALSGEEALALCLHQDLALILLDVNMPGMDGYETSENLRGYSRTKDVPIIFVTAMEKGYEHEEKGYDSGAVDYIQKPINPRFLLAKVKIFLELYHQKQTLIGQSQLLDEKNRRLQEEVVERKREAEMRKQVAEELKRANRAVNMFLANMSHEIRTPLNGILGFSQLLAQTNLDGTQNNYIEIIQKSGAHLLGLINDVLDLSKIEANRLALEKLPLQLNPILKNTVDLVRLDAEKKGVVVSWEGIAEENDHFLGDAHRLRQILLNLLANAVKFTHQGTVHLKGTLQEEETGSSIVTISVRDTGIGISQENLENIFKPFVQADSSTTRSYGGTGLGLSISNQLAQLMGGGLRVESAVGVGSCFFCTIRLEKTEKISLPEKTLIIQRKSPFDLSKCRLLLAEDDDINRLFITETLRYMGIENIGIAHNGQEAVDKVAEQPWDIVLMDCQMPLMDGYKATREIRVWEQKNCCKKPLPIIALTANVMHEDFSQCIRAGMNHYLSKPLNIEDLKRVLVNYLANPDPVSVESVDAPQENSEGKGSEPINSDDLRELQDMFGAEKFTVLARAFASSLPGKVALVREAASVGDTKALHQTAHTLKGNSGMIKAKVLFEVCQELVQLGKSGKTLGVEPLLDRLDMESKRTIHCISKIVGQTRSASL